MHALLLGWGRAHSCANLSESASWAHGALAMASGFASRTNTASPLVSDGRGILAIGETPLQILTNATRVIPTSTQWLVNPFAMEPWKAGNVALIMIQEYVIIASATFPGEREESSAEWRNRIDARNRRSGVLNIRAKSRLRD